jgi:hypothetical protein
MADLIKAPLLLIHGDADNNPGTHTMQSERFYAALKGHGCPTRLVLLPHESHGYGARTRARRQMHVPPNAPASPSITLVTAHTRPTAPHPHTPYAVARESVLHMLYEQDQWLERYAGYGRTDPDYGAPSGSVTEGSVSE